MSRPSSLRRTERYNSDPAYREHVLAQNREARARRVKDPAKKARLNERRKANAKAKYERGAAPTGFQHVYVVQSGKYFKIGRARNPRSRANEVSVDSPLPTSLLWTSIPLRNAEAKRLESECHRCFVDVHVRGEWFQPPSAQHLIKVVSDATRLAGLGV